MRSPGLRVALAAAVDDHCRAAPMTAPRIAPVRMKPRIGAGTHDGRGGDALERIDVGQLLDDVGGSAVGGRLSGCYGRVAIGRRLVPIKVDGLRGVGSLGPCAAHRGRRLPSRHPVRPQAGQGAPSQERPSTRHPAQLR